MLLSLLREYNGKGLAVTLWERAAFQNKAHNTVCGSCPETGRIKIQKGIKTDKDL